MAEASPPAAIENTQKEPEQSLMVVSGGKRVHKRRGRAEGRSHLSQQATVESDGEASDGVDETMDMARPVTHQTSNHYTLNVPGPTASRSDMPYVLLGYVSVGHVVEQY